MASKDHPHTKEDRSGSQAENDRLGRKDAPSTSQHTQKERREEKGEMRQPPASKEMHNK